MNKFNRRFTSRIRRFERWNKIADLLCQFEGIVNNYECAEPDEVRALKSIHSKLYECYLAAKHFREDLKPYE